MKYKEHLEVQNFEQLKKKAYATAKEGLKNNFSEEWKASTRIYFPSSIVFRYRELVDVYRDYFLKIKTEEECKEVILNVEHRFTKAQKALDETVKFLQAQNKAFEEKGIEFGEVEFECPLCGGKAWASRKHTPENFAHSITVRATCEGCGTKHMN